MNWIPSIFRRRALYDDLSEEIQLHIEERAEQLMSQGMSAGQAMREARRAFGNRTVLEERSRRHQVAGVDAFGIAIEEVRDLGLRQHAVNLARREEEPGNTA